MRIEGIIGVSTGERLIPIEIELEHKRLRQAVTPLKNNSQEIVGGMALLALITGVLSIFVVSWLWPIRLILSFLTFVSAVIITKRVVYAKARVTASASASATETVESSEKSDE